MCPLSAAWPLPLVVPPLLTMPFSETVVVLGSTGDPLLASGVQGEAAVLTSLGFVEVTFHVPDVEPHEPSLAIDGLW